MNLVILGLEQAVQYNPTNPTYAIRIKGSERFNGGDYQLPKLMASNLFREVKEYTFDDIDHHFDADKGLMFNPQIADKLLTDFHTGRNGCETLLVHCSRGKNRSPAVGIALNEIFSLDENTLNLIRAFPHFTHFITNELMKSGQRLGLVEKFEPFYGFFGGNKDLLRKPTILRK